MGQTIVVELSDKLIHNDNLVGCAVYRDNKIILQQGTPAVPVIKSQFEQTFLHELVHFILDAMGKSELRANEEFVDLFAGLLHQALTTGEGDHNPEPTYARNDLLAEQIRKESAC
jgi:hypothetical protein